MKAKKVHTIKCLNYKIFSNLVHSCLVYMNLFWNRIKKSLIHHQNQIKLKYGGELIANNVIKESMNFLCGLKSIDRLLKNRYC